MHGKCSGSEKKMLALDEVSNFAEQPIKKNVAEEQTYWTIQKTPRFHLATP